MVTEAFVQVATDGAGKKLDTRTVTQADGGTAHRETVVVADPTNPSALQGVTLGGESLSRSLATEDQLAQILVELKVLNHLIHSTQNSTDDLARLRAEFSNTAT